MDRKVEEIKYKVLDLINKKKDVKIPKMGFTDYYVQHSSVQPQPKHSSVPGSGSSGRNSAASGSKYDQFSFYDAAEDEQDGGKETVDGGSKDSHRLSDQEILESTEAIYFDSGSNTGLHELKKLSETDELLNCQCIEKAMGTLKQQHKVISKKVLQLILEQRPACSEEFLRIQETESLLRETIAKCRTTRSHLDGSRKLLTTTNLEILAAYKKRQTLINLLKTLNALKSMRSIDQRLQKRLSEADYSGAISILLENKNLSERFQQYNCIESLSTKLQDTLMMSEIQLEAVLNEVPVGFDAKKYSKLQEAYKLLEKQLIAMDQLHMNFISSIHTAAFTVLKQHAEASLEDNRQKLTFEQMCENVPCEEYIHCLTDLCRAFWKILVSYYQKCKMPTNGESSGIQHGGGNGGRSETGSVRVPSRCQAIEKLKLNENYLTWAFAMGMILIQEGSCSAVGPAEGEVVSNNVKMRALATMCLSLESFDYSLVQYAADVAEAWKKNRDVEHSNQRCQM